MWVAKRSALSCPRLATDTVETSSPGDNVVFENEIAALTTDVKALEAEGVDKVIALTHVGL